MNARNFSDAAAPDEPGRWASRPPNPSSARASVTALNSEPAPLSWEPAVPFARRLARSLNIPALVGIVVFTAVLIITAVIMVQGIVADSGEGAAGFSLLEGRASESSTTNPSATREPEGTAPPLLVHVVGEVVSPGVVDLPPGSRVRDAIAAAGGPTEAAVLSGVNLARTVSDGEQIVVPDEKEAQMLAPGGSNGGSSIGPSGVINLNRATAEQLEQLPRVGPALAQRIVEWRTAHGGFASVDQLLEVSGIGAKTLDGFRDRVTV